MGETGIGIFCLIMGIGFKEFMRLPTGPVGMVKLTLVRLKLRIFVSQSLPILDDGGEYWKEEIMKATLILLNVLIVSLPMLVIPSEAQEV